MAISGDVDAVERACELCRARGARRAVRLPVSGAFHSPLMEPAVEEFRPFLSERARGSLRVDWIANVTGEVVRDAGQVVDLLARQLSSPVRWTRSMHNFVADGPDAIYEVGPGNVLSGLMKRIVDGVEVTSLSACDALPVG
jgi:[acyl-carrier-protein] S-malonyltransferase